jgi:hypothetical protein
MYIILFNCSIISVNPDDEENVIEGNGQDILIYLVNDSRTTEICGINEESLICLIVFFFKKI